jgi:hypothetical protein
MTSTVFECWNNGKAYYAFKTKAEAFAHCRMMQSE